MSFDIKNIGKFIEMKSVRYSTFPFQLVMGYDFIRNNYIVGEIDFIPSLYSAASSILSKEKIVFYSLEEVLKLIDDRIEIENKKLSKLNEIVNFDKISSMQENYRNECESIFNAYRESYKQVEILKGLIKSTADEKNSKINKIYKHELSKTQKALRRLDKRYHFFFGDKADNVKTIVIENTSFRNPYVMRREILKTIEKYIKQKVKLKNVHERLPDDIKNNS